MTDRDRLRDRLDALDDDSVTPPDTDRAEGDLSPLAERLRKLDDIYRDHVDGNARKETGLTAFACAIGLDADEHVPATPTPEAERIVDDLKESQVGALEAYEELYPSEDTEDTDR